uniref:Putative pyruvate dehydrogenase phosphatase isoenzyme 2 n=1 Tax=Gasterosteus aculeatus aculeatus TaxID=481459 RepID=A0AAQ4R6R9_GASAC
SSSSSGPRRSDQRGLAGEETGNWSQSKRLRSTRRDIDFMLSAVQINGFLRSNEQTIDSVSVPEFDGRGLCAIQKFESNQLAANTPNEDRRSAATCLRRPSPCIHLPFRLLTVLASWPTASTTLNFPKSTYHRIHEKGSVLPCLYPWYLQSNLSATSSPNESPTLGQVPLYNDLMKSTAIQVAFSVCTACVAHVSTDRIHVANSGDSRAVLGVLEEDGSWSALPLSLDHNTQNQAEVERIKAQHPPSERAMVVTDDRLLGVLMPLRGFGDVRFKWSLELQQSILAGLESGVDLDSLNLYQYTPPNYLTPPYLDVAPEVTHHKLRPQDRFLILGTDGLWDELGNKEAVRLVGEHLSGIHLQAPVSPSERQMKLGQMHKLLLERPTRASPALDANVATHLIRNALGTGEYGELGQQRLATMLTLPEDLARLYRDDITATVVYLNSDLARPQHC